jgi:protein arginine phosphatase
MRHLLSRKKKKKIVVFLCTGNTCRGPMAQGYMKKAMADREMKDVEVKTAGVMTIPGLIPTAEASQVMKAAEVDIVAHRSSPLTKELIRKADLILGMTPFHVQFALRMSDEAVEKTHLLKEFAESDVKNYQITDPMGATLEVYKRVYREMKLAIDRMLDNKEFFTGIPEDEAKKKKTAKAPVKKTKKKKTATASDSSDDSPEDE